MKRLLAMLSYKRPHGSKSEAAWVKRFIMPYNPEVIRDRFGDPMVYVVQVGESTTLFSAHIDTMHRTPGRQKVIESDGILFKADGEPLGADDGAGVWLLLEMIDAGIPGAYTFPVGEERGGIGSSWFAENIPDFLRLFSRAITFDRRGVDSIITHQACGRCCSDKFAETLADQLNSANNNFMYSPDDTGVYTDTAEYIEMIPECTNVSCGYQDEHTPREQLDVAHIVALRDACLRLDWESLPVVRDPSEIEPRYQYSWPKHKAVPESVFHMTREEMLEACAFDPDDFIDMLRCELELDDVVEVDFHAPKKSRHDPLF